MIFKIGVTGTQDGITARQLEAFGTLIGHYVVDIGVADLELHHGMCVGADATADLIARSVGIRRVGHPPTNESKMADLEPDELRPAKPYLVRDQDIVDEGDALIALPKQDHEVLRSGTWATVRMAVKRGLATVIIWPDGKMEVWNVRER